MNEEKQAWLEQIRRLPQQLEALVSHLTEEQLTTHFLAGEWKVWILSFV